MNRKGAHLQTYISTFFDSNKILQISKIYVVSSIWSNIFCFRIQRSNNILSLVQLHTNISHLMAIYPSLCFPSSGSCLQVHPLADEGITGLLPIKFRLQGHLPSEPQLAAPMDFSISPSTMSSIGGVHDLTDKAHWKGQLPALGPTFCSGNL